MLKIFALDYPKTGNSGGWSRSAKHRPQPVVASGEIESSVEKTKRRKFTAFDLATVPPTLVRRDYALEELRKLGAVLPETYIDELGNIRDAKDQIVFRGPGVQAGELSK